MKRNRRSVFQYQINMRHITPFRVAFILLREKRRSLVLITISIIPWKEKSEILEGRSQRCALKEFEEVDYFILLRMYISMYLCEVHFSIFIPISRFPSETG